MMNSKPKAPHPLSHLKRTAQELWRMWTSDSSLRSDRSLWEVLRILWENLTGARTHAYYTGVAPGVWADARHRLETAMTTSLVRFLEGDWYNHKRALSDRDLPAEPTPELIAELLEEEAGWKKGREKADHTSPEKAVDVYRYLKFERPRLTSIIEELDERVELTITDEEPLVATSNEAWSDRRQRLEVHRTKRDREVLAEIGEIVHWMWV